MPQHDLLYYLQRYDALTEGFIDTFSAFAKTTYNAPIAEGKWSPGQYVEHVIKSERAFGRILGGGTAAAPAGRAADKKCAAIEEGLPVTAEPLQAPESVRPDPERRFSPAVHLDAFVDGRADLRAAVDFAPDPGAVATAYAHFLFGEMTLTEWLLFTAFHGERHRRQVEAARR